MISTCGQCGFEIVLENCGQSMWQYNGILYMCPKHLYLRTPKNVTVSITTITVGNTRDLTFG